MIRSSSPYRFAILSYIKDLQTYMPPIAGSEEYSLDYHAIKYDQSDFGARDLLEQGYEVLLIFSAFAQDVIDEVGYSAINLQRTDMDMIQALRTLGGSDEVVAIPVHRNENVDIAGMEELCGVRLHKIPYASMEELHEGIMQAFRSGIKTMAGGGFSATMTAHLNVRFVPIFPNAHGLATAINHAKSIARAKRREKIRQEELLSIFKLSGEGVIYFDQNRNSVYSNSLARKLLGVCERPLVQSSSVEGKDQFTPFQDKLFLSDALERRQPSLEQLVTINKKQLVVSTLPVFMQEGDSPGAVVFMRDVASVHAFAGRVRASQVRQQGFSAHTEIDHILGGSAEMHRLRSMIEIYAEHDSPVFIYGETGTGKDLVAQALHNAGPRKGRPFVAINCAAIPESLLESELFGYEEGAFTGARRGGKAGVFEMAHTGTLFLDEVGDLGYNAQLRLLRVLETREVLRVGGEGVIPVDIRVISATHKALPQLVQEGSFRKDLFYRLAVLRLNVPPLRRRLSDIPLLLNDLCNSYGCTANCLSPRIRSLLESYSWPGNIRELRSIVEGYLVLLRDGRPNEDLFAGLFNEWVRDMALNTEAPGNIQNESGDLKFRLEKARKRIVEETVTACGSKQKAAERLGISYNTLWRIMGRSGEEQD